MFEDLHWADPASLDLIGYLIRSRGWPGAIVATYRSDELHRRHPLVPWLAEIARVPFVERIELRRLDRSDVEAQVGAILGRAPDAALVDELLRRADGNAFFTEELLAAARVDGTIPRATGVQQLLLARIAGLPGSRAVDRRGDVGRRTTRRRGRARPGARAYRSATSRRRCEWRSTRRC